MIGDMASMDVLNALLQTIHNDASAAIKLPSILSALSSHNIDASPSLNKWTNRVSSLIHSKEPGARWAGISLALETSRQSQNVMLSSGQGWVTTVLPLLSKSESAPIWKASIRLITFTFISTLTLAEFQRQVVLPNVPKLSTALISIAEKRIDEELSMLCLDSLRTVVPLFPTQHRPISGSLSSMSLGFLNGFPLSAHSLMESAARLHACLHTTGGKVGGPSFWRKSVDETIVFCITAVRALRTTFVPEGGYSVSAQADPLEFASLNLNRLRCGIELLCCLLRENLCRAAVVPVNALVNACLELISVTDGNALPSGADSSTRSIESTVISSILKLGCHLADIITLCLQHKIMPHFGRIIAVIAYQLEQAAPIEYRLPFVKLVPALFAACPSPPDPLIVGRVLKAILPTVASLLSQKSSEDKKEMSSEVNGRKGKKRARNFEGDEFFKVGQDTLCSNDTEGEMVIACLEALPHLLRTPRIPAYLESLCSRLLLSLLLAVPKLPWSSISRNPTLRDSILRAVKASCLELTLSSSAVYSRSAPLVLDAMANGEAPDNKEALFIDLLLHPRVPPVLRPIPRIDTIALRQSEESAEERKLRETLGLRETESGMDVENDESGSTASSQVPPVQTSSLQREPAPLSPVKPRDALAEKVAPTRQPVTPDMPSSHILIPSVPTSVTEAPSAMQDITSTIEEAHPQSVDIIMQRQEMVSGTISQQIQYPEVPPVSLSQKTETGKQDRSLDDRKASSSLPTEITRKIIDDDDDDMELPTIDPRSDTESELDSE